MGRDRASQNTFQSEDPGRKPLPMSGVGLLRATSSRSCGRVSHAPRRLPHALRRRSAVPVRCMMAKHGDARLTDLLLDLAQCEKARSLSVHDRCKAVYESLAVRRMTSE
jgi:hypothetical protein